jgi:hypothetical protein
MSECTETTFNEGEHSFVLPSLPDPRGSWSHVLRDPINELSHGQSFEDGRPRLWICIFAAGTQIANLLLGEKLRKGR